MNAKDIQKFGAIIGVCIALVGLYNAVKQATRML